MKKILSLVFLLFLIFTNLMKKILSLVFLLFLIFTNLYSSRTILKEKNIELYYEQGFNTFSLEYMLKLSKEYMSSFSNEFKVKRLRVFKLYIYDNIVKFMGEEKANWWQNFVVKSNYTAIYNVNLLMQKNELNLLLKYLIYNTELLFNYNGVAEKWFINGLALYFAKINCGQVNNSIILDYKTFKDKLINSETEDEFKQVNYICKKAVAYLFENYDNSKILNLLNNSKSMSEFKNNFFNIFGLTYNDFINSTMGLNP